MLSNTIISDKRMMSAALLLNKDLPMAHKCSLKQLTLKRLKYYLRQHRKHIV